MKKIIPFTITTLLFCTPSMGAEKVQGIGAVTGWEIPRFVSTKSMPVNVRTGPGKRYPVKAIYQVKLPVQIIDEYGHWRKIQDWQGETGWIQKLLLGAKRLAMVKLPIATLYSTKTLNDGIIARLRENVIVQLNECKINWCEIDVQNTDFSGYISTNDIWGVEKNEVIED